MGLHRFDFVYRIIPIYQLVLLNSTVCYFVSSVRCLTFHLHDFNSKFQELLESRTKSEQLSERLLAAFSFHKTLAQKVRQMDGIFRVFIFCMLVTNVPMTVFGAITLVRRKNLLSFIFALYDVIFCTVQLTVLTMVPAKLYAELYAFPSHIYWGHAVWTRYDPEVFQILRTVSEYVQQLQVGLSFGGLVIIRKSSVLTAIVLIVPYVVLSYQLYTQGGKNSQQRVMFSKLLGTSEN
ncbi:CBR-GUR-5 protein [Ditylenchus destructor]|uniref:CBR-GUR-5 protein n=1 Tax=Ditylenchus destructor TaxID=166010 RepID=A0AAD4MYC8_9BILA|nr:CBR-GUR-5 protein [Ditylenchus destructor]